MSGQQLLKGPKVLLSHTSGFFMGGLFGWHHVYLGNTSIAVVYNATLGGFGLGWVRDLFRMSDIVADANNSPEFLAGYQKKLDMGKKPSMFSAVGLGMVVLIPYLRIITVRVLPNYDGERSELHGFLVAVIGSFTVACSMYYMGTAHRRAGLFRDAFVGAVIGEYISYNNTETAGNGFVVVIIALICFTNSGNWVYTTIGASSKRTSFWRTTGRFLLWVTFFWAICGVAMYQNMEVGQENRRLKEKIRETLDSPNWAKLGEALKVVYYNYRSKPWGEFFKDFQDITGIGKKERELQEAYVAMDLNRDTASKKDIKKNYYRLAKQYHPDKCSDVDKLSCTKKFEEISKAYDILLKHHSNTKEDSPDPDDEGTPEAEPILKPQARQKQNPTKKSKMFNPR